ncbi:MAG: aminotransferase [Rhodobacterales bacterium]|nr:MAG: aminotransferase [Rhodobacterales bacterium]
MPLAHGREYLAIPGPSVMPEAVLRAMHRSAPNIYEGELVEMTAGLIPDLKSFVGTEGHVAIYIANGHGTWEAALSNVLSRGDKVLVAATGLFAKGWAEMAAGLGIEVELMDFGTDTVIDPDRVAQRLRDDPDHSLRAVLAVHTDTSSSLRSDMGALGAAIRDTGHPALFMVDCIASLGCDVVEMDAWQADVLISASQKGLMVPPGLGFVWFNDRADSARDRADLASHYWDWRPRANATQLWQYFDGTAPTHHLYGLRAALDLIAAEGRAAIWHRHEVLARTVWSAAEAWGAGGALRLNVAEPAHRSHAVTTLHLPGGGASRLREWCASHAGVTLGIGLGFEPADDTFRIGHMGHVNAHMVLGVLAVIEAGLIACDIPHGGGALTAAAQVVASA